MHTGHSVYGTLHANSAKETINRLTSPPIDLPKQVLTGLSLIVVQNINRRTGKRKTLQIAEVTQDGDARVIMQLNQMKDELEFVNEPQEIVDTLGLYAGLSKASLFEDMQSKITLLKWMASKNVNDFNRVGMIMSRYYRSKPTIKSKGV